MENKIPYRFGLAFAATFVMGLTIAVKVATEDYSVFNLIYGLGFWVFSADTLMHAKKYWRE